VLSTRPRPTDEFNLNFVPRNDDVLRNLDHDSPLTDSDLGEH
jgi:hypothetical protein